MSLGRALTGVRLGSRRRKKVPRLFGMRSQGGGAWNSSMNPFMNAICRTPRWQHGQHQAGRACWACRQYVGFQRCVGQSVSTFVQVTSDYMLCCASAHGIKSIVLAAVHNKSALTSSMDRLAKLSSCMKPLECHPVHHTMAFADIRRCQAWKSLLACTVSCQRP